MSFINDLLGGDRKAAFDDFIGRFEQGKPGDGIGDEEAAERYSEVTPNLSDDQYRESAEAAFSRLSPQERAEFGRWMTERARSRGVSFPDLDGDGRDDRLQDPGALADATTRVRKQDPNILEQILGKGGTGGAFDNPIAKVAAAGIAAMAASKLMGRR